MGGHVHKTAKKKQSVLHTKQTPDKKVGFVHRVALRKNAFLCRTLTQKNQKTSMSSDMCRSMQAEMNASVFYGCGIGKFLEKYGQAPAALLVGVMVDVLATHRKTRLDDAGFAECAVTLGSALLQFIQAGKNLDVPLVPGDKRRESYIRLDCETVRRVFQRQLGVELPA